MQYTALLRHRSADAHTSGDRGVGLLERVEPDAVIVDQNLSFFNLCRRHLLDHFFQADRRVRIAANGAERVPGVGPHQVDGGQAAADLIVPADPRLRAGVALERGAQVPLEGPSIVARDPEAEGIHHADQFFGIRIARPGCGPEALKGLFKSAGIHEVTRDPDIRQRWRAQKHCKNNGFDHWRTSLAGLCLALGLGSTVFAQTPPLGPEHFRPVNLEAAEVGRLLFYDKILSGNRNISCGTCHHHDLGTGDGLSLGLGEGAEGLGRKRRGVVDKRIPRNAPPLWNLGAAEIDVLFHDGRLSVSDDFGVGFNSPVEENLPRGLNGILAVQALFPMTARFEMAGAREDNEISRAAARRMQEAWPLIARRVRAIPEYEAMLRAAYPEIESRDQISIVHIANALADFMSFEFRSFDSPYDRFLAGDLAALRPGQSRGMALFFGQAGCSECHGGRLLSDLAFHALALPQFGPGRTRAFDPAPRDVGRMAETDRLEDAYRFRTPMLRNVALTAPYGHNGAYPTLEGIVRHHLDPLGALGRWTPDLPMLPPVDGLSAIDFIALQDQRERARLRARVDITPRSLTDAQVADLVAFLNALTGVESSNGRLGRPDRVPSGLAVD